MRFDAPPEQRRQYGVRAGHARAAKYAHVVEGQYVSTRQIAHRLGVSHATAYDRAKRGPFPLTWASLGKRTAPAEAERSISINKEPTP